jgi:predicted dehydrogenase
VGDVRIGVIGAGKIAEKHLEVLAAIGDTALVGITSRTLAPARALSQRFGGVEVFDSVQRLVRTARPDALMVLVSAASVSAVAREALSYGVPLFIEKPAGLCPVETGELAALAAKRRVRTMVGYNRRHYSIFAAGIDIIRQHGPLMGVLVEGHERICAVRAVNKHDVTVLDAWLYANATHTIDLLRFFGGEPLVVHSVAHRYRERLGDQFGATIEFTSGAIGHYVAHWLSPAGWRVALYGDGVTVEFKPLESGWWTDRTGSVHELEASHEDRQFKPGFYGQMQEFCKLVRNSDARSPQDLESAYRTMVLAEQMAESVRDSRTVT